MSGVMFSFGNGSFKKTVNFVLRYLFPNQTYILCRTIGSITVDLRIIFRLDFSKIIFKHLIFLFRKLTKYKLD